jgi:low affinity Fe/Cu permease
MRGNRLSFSARCEGLSSIATAWTGTTVAQMAAVATCVAWLVAGPVFGWERSWHLVFEPLTSFVPFLMVFLIQRSQNKDSMAVQLKLNELVAALQGASNGLIDVEDLSEDELKVIRAHYRQLATMAKKETEIGKSHSIEEAEARHSFKAKGRSRSS